MERGVHITTSILQCLNRSLSQKAQEPEANQLNLLLNEAVQKTKLLPLLSLRLYHIYCGIACALCAGLHCVQSQQPWLHYCVRLRMKKR